MVDNVINFTPKGSRSKAVGTFNISIDYTGDSGVEMLTVHDIDIPTKQQQTFIRDVVVRSAAILHAEVAEQPCIMTMLIADGGKINVTLNLNHCNSPNFNDWLREHVMQGLEMALSIKDKE